MDYLEETEERKKGRKDQRNYADDFECHANGLTRSQSLLLCWRRDTRTGVVGKRISRANMPPIPLADIIPCDSPPRGGKAMCCSGDADVGRETELGCSSHLRSSGAARQMDWWDLKPWDSRDSTRKSCASLPGAGRGAAARSPLLNSETALPLDAVPAYGGVRLYCIPTGRDQRVS